MNRQKQIEVTEDILAQIERVTKTSLSADDIVVFEAAACSTRPISKAGSIYDGARMSRALLQEMAEALNDGSESVPLHTLHLQGDEIPKGRVFQASVADEPDGSATLRAMFYLPLAEKELIEKINLGILDEVSIGQKSKQALCSKCGFDYFGEDADFVHLFSQTCENDHTIGQDGTHLKLSGHDKWMELSLVSRGASDKPKILSRPKQLLPKEEYDRIAADGKPMEALFLFTSMATETPEMPKENLEAEEAEEVQTEEVQTEETEEVAEFDAKSAIEALEVKLDSILERLPTLEAAAEEEVEEAEEEVEEVDLEAQLAAAQARIAELEAGGEPEVEEVEEAVELDLPVDGVAASAVEDAKSLKATSGRAAAFKTKR